MVFRYAPILCPYFNNSQFNMKKVKIMRISNNFIIILCTKKERLNKMNRLYCDHNI